MGAEGRMVYMKEGLGLRPWGALIVGTLLSLIGVLVSVAEPSPAAVTISFGRSTLHNETSTQPTSLQFGPDGRLYVAEQNGLIKIYTVKRNGANNYAVTATQTITKIKNIPNHNDNGTLNTAVTNRLVTGILVSGTAAIHAYVIRPLTPTRACSPS